LVRALTRRWQGTATLVPLSNQGTLEEIEPFLHGIECVTKVPDCRIRRRNNGRAAFKPFSEIGSQSHNDHANRDGPDDRHDRDSWLHRFGSGLKDS